VDWADCTPEGWLCPHLRVGSVYPTASIHRDERGVPWKMSFTERAEWGKEWCPICGWVRRTEPLPPSARVKG
jgi:hypothetical protein